MSSVTLEHLAVALGVTKSAVVYRALRERWPYTEQPVRGGRKRFYRLEDLPVEVRAAVLLKGDFGGGAGCALRCGHWYRCAAGAPGQRGGWTLRRQRRALRQRWQRGR
jgi:hypothetical protein